MPRIGSVQSASRFSGSLYLFLLTLILAVGVSAVIGFALNDLRYIYVCIAVLASVLPLSVAAFRRADIFEPITLVGLALAWATSLRAIYIVSGGANAPFLMMGQDWSDVTSYALLSFSGVAALCAGYLVCRSRFPVEAAIDVGRPVDSRRLYILVGAGLLVGLVGVAIFASQQGINLSRGLLALSMKRSNLVVDDDGSIGYAVGFERYLGGFAQYAFLILAAGGLSNSIKRTPAFYAIIGAAFLVTCAIPFMASSRSSIIVPIINAIILAYYYGKLRWRTVLIGATMMSLIIVGMGNLRAINQTGVSRSHSVIDAVFGAGNGIDFVRTSGIMAKSDEMHVRLFGSSYIALVTAPVPRSIWPSKPDVSLGPWVKSELYGQPVRKNGWPSGMIAEAYVNFGALGVPVIMFLFGWLLSYLYQTVRPWLGKSFLVTVVYGTVIWRLAFGTIGLNFAHGVMQSLQYAVPMAAFALLALVVRRYEFGGQPRGQAWREPHLNGRRLG